MTFFAKTYRFIQTPLFFGLLYLILIPSYAYIYFKLPNSFYQSTSSYEKIVDGWQVDPEINYSLLLELCDSINSNYKNFTGRSYIVTNNKDTLKNLLSTDDADRVTTLNDQIIFPLIFPQNDSAYVTVYLAVKANTGDRSYLGKYAEVDFRQVTVDTISDKNWQKTLSYLDYNIWDIFPYPYHKYSNIDLITGQPENFGYIKITKSLQNKINNITLGLNTDATQGDFWKMFYFSSVTITTLGYGDIVPITKKARLLVSSEAILGIVIIGLFLNALANKIKKS